VTTNPEVDAWFDRLEHPLKAEMLQLRGLLLAADSRLTEAMKWQSPTFMFKGNLASIDPHAKRHVSLLFHRGADIPGEHPALEGGGKVARYLRLEDGASIEAARPALEAVTRAWCDWKDSGPAPR